MGKKVLKRSLVLGALMAFVITGNAWAEEPLNEPWSKEELESAIASGDGTAVAIIMDSDSEAGPHAAYEVTDDAGTLKGNIHVEAIYKPNVSRSGHEVAALYLEGTDKDNKAKFDLNGDVNFEMQGNASWRNHAVMLDRYSDYTQIGNLNMTVIGADNADAIHTLKLGQLKYYDAHGHNTANVGNEMISSDINLEVINSTVRRASVVNVNAKSTLTQTGDVKLYANNFSCIQTSSGNYPEAVSGVYARNASTVVLDGTIDMTFINSDNSVGPIKDNIFGAQLINGSVLEHDGDININLGGSVSDLLRNDNNKGHTIYAYVAVDTINVDTDNDGIVETYEGRYEKIGNNVATLSFGAVDKEGKSKSFISDENDKLTWSFANFDVVKVTKDSHLYIDGNQIDGYSFENDSSGTKGKYTPIEEKIHSADGAINLGANTMILENNSSATMDKLIVAGAEIFVGKDAKLTIQNELAVGTNGVATFQSESDGEVPRDTTFVIDVSSIHSSGHAVELAQDGILRGGGNIRLKASNLDLQGGAAQALKKASEVLEDAVSDNIINNTVGIKVTYDTTEAGNSALYGALKFEDDGNLTTTMDTYNLEVSGDVRATTFNGVNVEETASRVAANTQGIEANAMNIAENASNIAINSQAIANKAEKSTTLEGYGITNAYTKDETNAAISSAIASSDVVASKAEKSTTLEGYGITNAYTRDETDAAISNAVASNAAVAGKADKATTLAGYGITDAYTKTEADNAITEATKNKADKATTLSGYGITDAYTKTEADNIFVKKVNNGNGSIVTEINKNFIVNETDKGATVSINKGSSSQITIDADGKMIFGTNSTAIDSKGVYVGRVDESGNHDYDNAKAAMSDNGSIKGASGKFIVDGSTGDVQATSVTVTDDVVANGTSLVQTATKVEENKQAIATETSERQTEDIKLDKKISEEERARIEADEALQTQINNIGGSDAINGINQRLDRTNAKINKVGAGAAALAALHPLEYDPEDKLTFSVGMGNYSGENAAALGAFYRPNEKFMVSLGGTMGNGENMVNLGLSIGLDKANGFAKMSKRELIQEVNAVKAENEAIKADNEAIKADNEELEIRIAKLEALVAELAKK